LNFSIAGTRGAIFIGSRDLTRQNVLHHTPLRTHILKHHRSFLELGRKKKPSLTLSDIIFVTGYDITPSVASAVYATEEVIADEITFTPTRMNDAEASQVDVPWGIWSSGDQSRVTNNVQFQTSLQSSDDSSADTQDASSGRCSFLRGYRIRDSPIGSTGTSEAASVASKEDLTDGRRALSRDGGPSVIADDPLLPLFDYVFNVSPLRLPSNYHLGIIYRSLRMLRMPSFMIAIWQI
jgi:hypothetical protein